MAEHAVLRQRNYDAAIEHYKEALNFDPDDEVSISNTDYKQNFTLPFKTLLFHLQVF